MPRAKTQTTKQSKTRAKKAAQRNAAKDGAAKKKAAAKTAAKKTAAKKTAGSNGDKPVRQADIIREGIAKKSKRQTILNNLMKAAGKDEHWARARLALHENKTGEYAASE